MSSAFDPLKYPIQIRVLNGYLTASSPEFGIHLTKRFDEIRKAQEIGELYLEMAKRVKDEGLKLIQNQNPIPELKRPQLEPLNDDFRLSTKEAAAILGVTVTTVIRWVEAGKIRCKKTLGGHRRLSFTDVAAI